MRFRMSRDNLELLKIYFELLPPEKFLILYNTDFATYLAVKHMIEKSEDYIELDDNYRFANIELLMQKLINFAFALVRKQKGGEHDERDFKKGSQQESGH